jgi:hypothetical protein
MHRRKECQHFMSAFLTLFVFSRRNRCVPHVTKVNAHEKQYAIITDSVNRNPMIEQNLELLATLSNHHKKAYAAS